MIPSASAASVPMRIGRCQSAPRAVRLLRGSMTTTWHAALLRRLGPGPEMHVGGDEVGAPGDDQVAVVDRLRVGAADRADRHVPRLLAARVAHRAGDQPARAERVEQAEQQAAVHLPLMRAVGIAEQRQRPALGDDRLPAPGDLVERLVPEIGANLPSPLAPMRRSGVWMRSGECTSSASRLTLAQANPAVKGCSGSPLMRTTRPSSTSASSEHMSGQSCAQTTRTVSMLIRSVIASAKRRNLAPRRLVPVEIARRSAPRNDSAAEFGL